MWGNRVTRALMITILTNPKKDGKRVSHCVKKFKVPEFILELLALGDLSNIEDRGYVST